MTDTKLTIFPNNLTLVSSNLNSENYMYGTLSRWNEYHPYAAARYIYMASASCANEESSGWRGGEFYLEFRLFADAFTGC